MDTVPIEILHCILDYVAPACEADSQAACLRVCKLWRDVVKRVAKPIHDTFAIIRAAYTHEHDRLLCWLIYSGYHADTHVVIDILQTGNMRLVRCLSKHRFDMLNAMLRNDPNITSLCTPKVVKYLLNKMNCQSHAGSIFVDAVITCNFPVAEMLLKYYDPHGRLAAAACPLAIGCRGSAALDWALSQQCPCNIQEIIYHARWLPRRQRMGLLHILARYYPADSLVKEALKAMGVFDGQIGSEYAGAYVLSPVPSCRSENYVHAHE